MTQKFRNVNRTGPKMVTLTGWEDIPSTAISDSYYGHPETFQNQISREHLYMNAADNSSKKATHKAITPDADGNIEIGITAGPNNTRAEKMFFLNAMRIEATAE